MRKLTVINKVEEVLTSNVSQDIELPLLLGEGIICYDAIVGVDYDHAPTSIILGYKSGVNEYLVYGEAAPIAGKPVSTLQTLYIPSGYKPFVRVVGGTLNDKIGLFVYGSFYGVDYPVSIVAIEG